MDWFRQVLEKREQDKQALLAEEDVSTNDVLQQKE
jgi:hypothetical protein